MNMIQSVKTCFQKYADFSGRASRSEFWWFTLFSAIPFFFFEFADLKVFSFLPEGEYRETFTTILLGSLGITNGLFGTLTSLILLVPGLAVTARRLHDVNLSGWWQMTVYGAMFLQLPFNDIPMEDPMSLIPMIVLLLAFLALIAVWVRKGTPGLNRYGPPTDHEDTLATFD